MPDQHIYLQPDPELWCGLGLLNFTLIAGHNPIGWHFKAPHGGVQGEAGFPKKVWMNEMKPETEELTEAAHCPNCFHPNPPEIDFCQNCGRPMGIIATYGPLEMIYTQGWLYRKAVSEPTRFILIGMWLLFGSTLLSLPFFIVQFLPDFRETYFAVGSFAFSWAISAAILYRITRKYFTTKRKPPPWENAV